jgi:glycerol uptake facilitator-like aquaporin
LFAGLTLKLVFGSLAPSAYLGSTKLAAGVSPLEGTALEVLGTFVLSMSALTAASVVKTTSRQALLVGGTLSTLILFIGPLTGASFNPARSLGPSLFSGYCDSQLVYWVGPLIGGACAGSIFRRLRKPR